MTIATAYWCILLVAVLPYIWTTVAKASGTKGRYDNRDPREWMAKQDNPRTRWANGAQLNSFETNPLFYASVLMAQFAEVPGAAIGLMAVIYAAARVAHGLLYVSGLHRFRSLAWFIGMASVFYLVVLAAKTIA